MKENKIKIYNSFREKYKDIERMQSIKSLNLTSEENFLIQDLNDLEESNQHLTLLEKLNFSDNFVCKLKLKKFPNLDSIIGTQNTITEVSLNLRRLARLDLSHNMITKIFDLTSVPLLSYLNLSYNLINEINISSFFPVHKTLVTVFLDYNEINFSSSSEFISLIEGMKGIYHLENLKLEGNIFIQKRQELTKNYKILTVAMLPQLIKLDDEAFDINRSSLNAEQIVSQILRDEKELNYNFKTKIAEKGFADENIHDSEPIEKTVSTNFNKTKETFSDIHIKLLNLPGSPSVNKRNILQKNSKYWEKINTDLILPFKKINNIFGKFNQKEQKDPPIFVQLVGEVKSLLSAKFSHMQIRYANNQKIKKLLDDEFAEFLMNCQILIETNPNYEETIYKAVAQFLMFARGKLFVENVFDFFSSLIKASTFKNDLIKEIIEEGIINQLRIQEDEMPINTLIKVVKFCNSSNIQCDKLYSDLIDRVFLNYEAIMIEAESFILHPLANEEGIRNYEACVEFIRKFLDLGKMDKTQVRERDEDIEMKKNFQIDNKQDSSHPYSSMSNPSRTSNDDLEFLHSNNYKDDDCLINWKHQNTIKDRINFEKKTKINLRVGTGFVEFFRIIYESCIFIFSKIEIILHFRNYDHLWNFFDKTINLLTSLCKNFDRLCNKYGVSDCEKEILRMEINTNNKNKIKDLEKFITIILNQYFKDVNAFNNSLESSVICFSDKNSSEKKFVILKYKNIFQKLLISYGCILRIGNSTEYFENDLVMSILEILNLIKNDEFILIGAIKFIFQIILNIRLETKIFKKILTKVKYFQILFRYINYEDVCYRSLYDKIYEENQPNFKKILKKNNSLLTLYTFENLKSNQLHKIFSQIIKLYRHISYLSITENPLKNSAIQTTENFQENNILKLISNCLKIPNDKLKKLSVESLYYTEKKCLTSDIIGQIMKIITAYDSVTRGETEIILSVVFILMTDLLYYHKIKDPSADTKFDYVNFKKFLRFSFGILKKNLDRNPSNLDEIEQKNVLSMSILLYLNSVSRYNDIYSDVIWDGIENDFRTIILYDFLYFHSDSYVPFEIERTFCGNNLSILLKVVQTKEMIPPYSYSFLRVFMKIADVLCYFREFSYPVDSGNDVHTTVNKLEKNIKKRIRNQNIREKMAWDQWEIDSSLEEINDRINVLGSNDKSVNVNDEAVFDYDDITYEYTALKLVNNNELFASSTTQNTNNNKNVPCEKEDSPNTNYVESCTFPMQSIEALIHEHYNFLAFFPVILNYLTGQSSNIVNTKIHQKLKNKFDKRIERSEEILAHIPESVDKGEYLHSLGEDETMTLLTKTHPSIAEYLNFNLNSHAKQFTEKELNNNNTMLNLIMIATNKDQNFNFYRTLVNENSTTDFLNDLKAGTFDMYGLDKIQKRIAEQESVDNPHIRSLVISTFLRCVYAVLISPSKKIREDFIEILFIESIWKDFILFIETGKIFEYNIFSKALLIFEWIFAKQNLIQFFSIMLKVNKDNDNSPKIRHFTDDASISKIPQSTIDMKIFHFYYVFAIYFEKILGEYYNNYFKPEIYDTALIKNIALTIHSFISNFAEINFSEIEEKFIQQTIYKKIFRNEFLDIILFSFKSLFIMRKKAMDKLREISLENVKFKYNKIFMDRMKLNTIFNEIDNETVNHIILFMDNLEACLEKFTELFGIIMYYYPEGENYIYEQLLKIFEVEEKEFFMFEEFIKKNEWESQNISEKLLSVGNFYMHKIKTQFLEKNENKVLINKEIFFETKKKFIKKKRIFLELFAFYQKLIFTIKSIKNFLSENISVSNSIDHEIDFTIGYDICEYQLVNSNSFCFTLLYLNREEIFLFKIDDNHLNQFSQRKISETFSKTLQNPLLKMKLEEVSTIFYFDYHNRIIINSVKNEFSLLFKSTNNAKKFVGNIKNYTSNKNLSIKNLSLIKHKISEKENLDNYVKKKLFQRLIMNETLSTTTQCKEKNEFMLIKTEDELKEKKKKQEEIKREFMMGNSIWNNFYSNEYFFEGINSFLVKFKKNIFSKENRKILFISDFYLYVLEENFKKFNPKNYENSADPISIYNTILTIRFEEISKIEKYSNLSLKLIYTEINSKTNQNIIFSFSGFFEYFLFLHTIDNAINQILIESKSSR